MTTIIEDLRTRKEHGSDAGARTMDIAANEIERLTAELERAREDNAAISGLENELADEQQELSVQIERWAGRARRLAAVLSQEAYHETERLEAEGADMREACICALGTLSSFEASHVLAIERLQDALSPDAGKDLLAVVEAARIAVPHLIRLSAYDGNLTDIPSRNAGANLANTLATLDGSTDSE